jgi:hypothetical protein
LTGWLEGRSYGLSCGPAPVRASPERCAWTRVSANFFDYVRVENNPIVERIQQTDLLEQIRQVYGKVVGTVGLTAMFWRPGDSALRHGPATSRLREPA